MIFLNLHRTGFAVAQPGGRHIARRHCIDRWAWGSCWSAFRWLTPPAVLVSPFGLFVSPNSRNSRQFQKVAEVIVEIFEFANQRRVVRIQAGRVNGLAVGGDGELCLVLGCGGAVGEFVKQVGDSIRAPVG